MITDMDVTLFGKPKISHSTTNRVLLAKNMAFSIKPVSALHARPNSISESVFTSTPLKMDLTLFGKTRLSSL